MIEVELTSPESVTKASQKLETIYAEELGNNADAGDLHLIYDKIKYLRTNLLLIPATQQ